MPISSLTIESSLHVIGHTWDGAELKARYKINGTVHSLTYPNAQLCKALKDWGFIESYVERSLNTSLTLPTDETTTLRRYMHYFSGERMVKFCTRHEFLMQTRNLFEANKAAMRDATESQSKVQ